MRGFDGHSNALPMGAEGQLLERDVTGKVRFFGGNLRATYDFAKKASDIAYENFSPTDSK